MDGLEFNVRIIGNPNFRADAVWGGTVFEYKAGIRDLRMLHSLIMRLAGLLTGSKERRAVLILDEPGISPGRLAEEWERLQLIIHPKLMERLSLVTLNKDSPSQVYGGLSKDEESALPEIRGKLRTRSLHKKERGPDAFSEILKVLLIHWFRKSGPLQLKTLAGMAGYSYPTLAAELKKLEPYLVRHSDRRVELKSFPRDAWFKLLANADSIRARMAFTSRRPRGIEVLLSRFLEQDRSDVALGGVVGAKHYLPGLDLLGAPRLDLVAHRLDTQEIRLIVERMDPALKQARRGDAPQVIFHTIVRPESFFVYGGKESPVADEVECLLDLHDARLESQSAEFVEFLKNKAQT